MFVPAARASAIGRMSALVVRALQTRGVETVVVRSEDVPFLDSAHHDFAAPLVRWDDRTGVESAAATSDAIVYHVGNNYDFHRGCVEWMNQLPGIVCLHDYFLGHLFWGWADARRALATGIVREWYGSDVAARYFEFDGPEEFIEGTHETAPMLEWIAGMADGLVTHSTWGIQRVLDSCPGPVHVTPLAYDASTVATHVDRRSDRPFTILTFGHINPNKRAESVIRALGRSPSLQSNAMYRLVGRIEPDVAGELDSLARRLGVNLSIAGEVDDRGLHDAIAESDVVCCLRLPSLEAASASTIESMLHGKATLVLDVGFYRELPDECVVKVAPDDERAGLQRRLEYLLAHPAQRQAIGALAAAWASRTFTAESYADTLLSVCETVARGAPLIAASRRFASTLAGWGATAADASSQMALEPLTALNRFD